MKIYTVVNSEGIKTHTWNDLTGKDETYHEEGFGPIGSYKVIIEDTEVSKVKKTERVTRVDKLKAIDWATITTVKECVSILKILVKEAIKDDE